MLLPLFTNAILASYLLKSRIFSPTQNNQRPLAAIMSLVFDSNACFVFEAQGFMGMPPAPPFALWNPAMHPAPMNQPHPPATPAQTTAQATPSATTTTTATPTTVPGVFPTAAAGSPMGQVIMLH